MSRSFTRRCSIYNGSSMASTTSGIGQPLRARVPHRTAPTAHTRALGDCQEELAHSPCGASGPAPMCNRRQCVTAQWHFDSTDHCRLSAPKYSKLNRLIAEVVDDFSLVRLGAQARPIADHPSCRVGNTRRQGWHNLALPSVGLQVCFTPLHIEDKHSVWALMKVRAEDRQAALLDKRAQWSARLCEESTGDTSALQ